MVDYKNDLYTWKRTKVIHVGKKSWKLRFLQVGQEDGSFGTQISGVEYGLFLTKFQHSCMKIGFLLRRETRLVPLTTSKISE